MEFLPPEIDQYADDHTSPESDLLHKINRETHLEVLKPRMLSGHLQGRLLSMISKLHRPHRILEIGTYTGYAALCLAEGLAEDGKLITLDKNEELERRVRGYFDESPFASQIELLIGNALEIIPTLKESWDLVFIDADKENYLPYYEMVIENVSTGGLIIADNVLWSGKVADDSKQDHDTQKIREFNDTIQKDKRVENVLLPVRDGLMMIRKK
jgi:predicted O-methyltransferase YrrM